MLQNKRRIAVVSLKYMYASRKKGNIKQSNACNAYARLSCLSSLCQQKKVHARKRTHNAIRDGTLRFKAELREYATPACKIPAFQRISSSKQVLKTVESRFPELNYFASGSTHQR
jgi:hypothetical protein